MAHHSTTRSTTGRTLLGAAWLLAPLAALGAAAALTTSGCQVAPAATAEHGAFLFSNYCAPCHGPTAGGKPEIAAPAIAGLPAWYIESQLDNYRNAIRGAHFDDLEGMRMRPMSLTLATDTDVEAVAGYVSSFAPSPGPATLQGGDIEAGKTTFNTVCAACHMPTGVGIEAVGAPTLLVQPDWYLYKQLGKFHEGIRGADPKRDLRGSQMRVNLLQLIERKMQEPQAANLSPEQVLDPIRRDVVAYIQTLRK
jgi:cytochrome c553